MRRRKLQQAEGEDNHEKEKCIDIVEAKWLTRPPSLILVSSPPCDIPLFFYLPRRYHFIYPCHDCLFALLISLRLSLLQSSSTRANLGESDRGEIVKTNSVMFGVCVPGIKLVRSFWS